MDLPNLFSANKSDQTEEMVLFILLSDIKVQAFLLKISDEGIENIEKSKVLLYEGIDKCLVQTDSCLQQLGKQSESVDSVIFGFEHAWVKNGEVIKEKKPLVKKITDDLSLKPLGFIVISEAIVEQEKAQNSLFSGIILSLSKSNMILTLVYQGTLKAFETVGRSTNSKSDFIEGLARLSAKSEKESFYLPTRIILASFDLSNSDLKEQQQNIYSTNWEEQTRFLQPPTVEVMSDDQFISILSQEAGRAIALKKGMSKAAFLATIGSKTKETSQPTKLDTKEMGFSDVNLKEDKKDERPTSFGIPISTKEFDAELIDKENDNLKEVNLGDDSDLAVELPKNKTTKKKSSKGLMSVFGKKDSKNKKHSNHKKPHKHHNPKPFIIGGFFAGILVFLGISFFALGSVSKANIELTLDQKAVFKELEISLDTTIEETDTDNLVIAASTVKKSLTSDSTMQTTGITIIGEKAGGRVALYNKTSAEKSFEKGTVLKVNELEFELDEDVTIASASSGQGETKHGRQDVNITARQIGAESNIAEKTELSVTPFDSSSYNAFVIDDDFVGGASREVKVVSQADRTELLSDLRKELIEEINKEFVADAVDGTYILPSTNITNEVTEFSSELEDEADELSLTLELEIEAITYTAEDLKPLASVVLADEVPENYELSDKDPQILSAPTENDLEDLDSTEPVLLIANITSLAIPIISIEDLKLEVAGKSISDSITKLESRDEIKKVEISIIPQILQSFVKKLPTSITNIAVTIVSKD